MPGAGVQLCYIFAIGSLANSSFEEIWFGDRANKVRQNIVADQSICKKSDYLRSHAIDDDEKENYFSGALLLGLDTIDFDKGVMDAKHRQHPIMVETIAIFNVVRYDGAYIGMPQSAGPVDLESVEPVDIPGAILPFPP